MIGRRGMRFGWPARQRFLEDEGGIDEQSAELEDAGNNGHSAAKADAPLGVLRFKANAQAWRQNLRRALLLAPLARPDRERLLRWLNNLRSREAWQAARLEHTIATKQLLLEVLREGSGSRPMESSTAVEEASPAEPDEAPDGVVLRYGFGRDNNRGGTR